MPTCSAAWTAAAAALWLAAAAVAGGPVGPDGKSWEQFTDEAGATAWRRVHVSRQSSPEPFLLVTAPQRMQVLRSWDVEPVSWNTSEAGDVKITLYHLVVHQYRYLRTVVHGYPNTGRFDWNVPLPPAYTRSDALYKLRVELLSRPHVAGESPGHFRIVCLRNCTTTAEDEMAL